MKTLVLSFAAVMALSLPALAKETTTTFKVSGWHCGGCGNKTEKALKGVSGVTAAKADREANSVTVTYDDGKTTVADLEKAVASIHYKLEK